MHRPLQNKVLYTNYRHFLISSAHVPGVIKYFMRSIKYTRDVSNQYSLAIWQCFIYDLFIYIYISTVSILK